MRRSMRLNSFTPGCAQQCWCNRALRSSAFLKDILCMHIAFLWHFLKISRLAMIYTVFLQLHIPHGGAHRSWIFSILSSFNVDWGDVFAYELQVTHCRACITFSVFDSLILSHIFTIPGVMIVVRDAKRGKKVAESGKSSLQWQKDDRRKISWIIM